MDFLCVLSDFNVVKHEADLMEVIGDRFAQILKNTDKNRFITIRRMLSLGDVLLQYALELQIVLEQSVDSLSHAVDVLLGNFYIGFLLSYQ